MKRKIGINGTVCFDDICNPSHRPCCWACGIKKPLKVYSGDEGKKESIKLMNDIGIGILLTKWRKPKVQYFAIDNGAFSAWKNKKDYDPENLLHIIDRCKELDLKPDFIVVPDIVAGGRKSLEFSLDWLKKLPSEYNYYLAIQDGMNELSIKDHLDKFIGLFIGGTLNWKYNTSERLIKFAHDNRKLVHIGRVGTWQQIIWSMRIGADSIDSSSWSQNGTYDKHLIGAMKQTQLPIVAKEGEN